LAGLLWPEHDQNAARSSLSNSLWQLKKVFGRDWLIMEREQVSLNPEYALWVDVNEFRSLLAQSKKHDHPEKQTCDKCVESLTLAVDLYRGDFMAGFNLPDNEAYEDWKASQNDKWCREFTGVLEKLVHYHDNQAEFEPAIHFAERWLQVDPLDENVHWHLMRLHARSGQPTAALRQYEECTRLLSKELNIRPQEKLKELYEEIQEQRIPAVSGSPLNENRIKNDLKPFLEPGLCIGRENEIKEIGRLLEDPACRLLTLKGPGGIGKTTLALQALREKKRQAPDKIFFIPLVHLTDPEWIVPTVADALGFVFFQESAPAEQLLAYLRDKKFLLILDNFEHLMKGVKFIADVLTLAPGIKLLVTSQQCLSLKTEWVLEVRGLEYPPDESIREIGKFGAVQLLLRRVGQIKPRFELTEDEKPFIIRICRFLNGMPLGIELVAAWSRMLSCREIAAAMEQDFSFLSTALNDLPDRQRSLQAVFERSWSFLASEEKIVFKKLTVFRSGFSVEAAKYVTGASLAVLRSLRYKSVLHGMTAERYGVFDVLRSFMNQKDALSESDYEKVRELHAEYFAAFLQQREDQFEGGGQNAAYLEIGNEFENIRSGWEWALSRNKPNLIGRYAESMFSFYYLKGWLLSGEKELARAIELLQEPDRPGNERRDEQDAVVGRLLSFRGWFCRFLARYDDARHLLQTGVSILKRLNMQKDLADALFRLGNVLFDCGQTPEAQKHFIESFDILKNRNRPGSLKYAMRNLGIFLLISGAFDEAQEAFESCLEICEQIGDRLARARILTNLGLVKEMQGKFHEAMHFHRESLAFFQEIGEETSVANCLTNLGFACLADQKRREAEKCFRQSLNIADPTGVRSNIHEALLGLAHICLQNGANEIALEITGHIFHHPTNAWNRKRVEKLLSELRPRFSEKEFMETMENGKNNNLDYYTNLFLTRFDIPL
jgi:DNA-binding SARP family transcriptional activator